MTRVLVVDDNEQNQYFLRALLEAHQFEVVCAANGIEALGAARERRPDLIVSDLLMPIMDGYSLLRDWKRDPELMTVPFVVFTATFTEPQDEELAIDLGADAFLLKPSDPLVLLARLREVLDRPSARSPRAQDHEVREAYGTVLIRKLEAKTAQLEAANRTLRQEQAVLGTLNRAVRAVSQGIVIADARAPDLPIVYVGPSFERLTGYPADEVLGKNCRFLQGKDTDRVAVATVRAALDAGRGCSVELLNYRKDGTPFWNDLTLSPVHDDQTGAVTHFIGVQTDVTERRNLEAQLRQAQKLEAVGLLAAGIAHDFNNLLSIILGYASLLTSGLDRNDPTREDLLEIQRAGERGAELTRQLLAFSRQQVVQPRSFTLSSAVREVERLLRQLLREDIALSIVADAVGRVHADPSQLEQVIVNLAVNARDAMPRGGTLTLRTADVELTEADLGGLPGMTAGSHLLLEVTDTGVGIDPTLQERIFEPFFTTKDKGRGTGLGLATVFGIVRQCGGMVRVDSVPNRGSTFAIYLPRSEGPHSAPLQSTPTPSERGTGTILLVEDDPPVRAVVRTVLERHGYTVLDAGSAEEGLRIAAAYRREIHLLLTDVVMPGMNGRELVERIGPTRPAMKVLYMSGYAERTIAHHGVLDPGVVLVEKPITPKKLLAAVLQVLGAPGEPS